MLFRLLAIGLLPLPVLAQQAIGPADAARIDQRVRIPEPIGGMSARPSIRVVESAQAPEGSEKIRFVLRGVRIDGAERYDDVGLRSTYAEYLDKEISLKVAWTIAGRITKKYQDAGYFLSRAYVPQQEIDGGLLRIRVVEGYIDEVSLDEKAASNALVVSWTKRVQGRKPLSQVELESLLLRLNDLSGQGYRAVLEPPKSGHAAEGATRLSIVTTPKKIDAQLSFDNFGSRFLGPYEWTQRITLPVIPNHKTNIALLAATQTDELRFGSINHEIPMGYDWSMDMLASRTMTAPGYTLETQDIESVSTAYGIGATYRPIRQRDENLSFRVGYESRDTVSDILGGLARLTEDHVRAMRGTVNYQNVEASGGYNVAVATLSQGIDGLGASGKGDANLSRTGAKPGFTKLEGTYSRLQPLPWNTALVGSVAGQVASGSLYSSEEFGYGGQSFGRAYDASELTGDHGLAASFEIRYNGIESRYGVRAVPYGFYDIGRVWNDNAGQEQDAMGSTAGVGMRMASELGITSNLGVAFPLAREIGTPLDGHKKGPRYVVQFSYDF